MIVRPSMKMITVTYVFALILAIGGAEAYWNLLPAAPMWPGAVFALLLIWPFRKHLRRQFTRLEIAGDKLRYETGLISKSTRIMELAKVQDTRVDQSIGQRIIGTGNLSIETAGETSRITILSIDRPREVAEQILHLAHPDASSAKGSRA